MEGEFDRDQRYLRAALSNQYNVTLVVGAMACAIALASWLPAVVAVAAEVAWLFVGPRLQWFRARTDAVASRAESTRALESLGREYAKRVAEVEADTREVDARCAARRDLTQEQKQEVHRRVRLAMQAFVGGCATHRRLRRTDAQVLVNELGLEVSSLHQALATETDLGVRASLRRASSAAERRLEQLEGNEAASRSLELALQTLQNSVAMLKEGAAGPSTGAELCAELDAAISQLSRAAAFDPERETELRAGRPGALPPVLN